MKLKLTFIVAQCDKKTNISDPNRFRVLLDDDMGFPSKYISTKDEFDTLKELSDEFLRVDFNWLPKEIHDAGIEIEDFYQDVLSSRSRGF